MRGRFSIVAIAFAWICLPGVAQADIDLGYISFDNLIPGAMGSPGVDGFTVANLTGDPSSGGNDLPPDFPVFTSVTFQNSALEWFSGPSSHQTVLLGNLGPGFYNPFSLQFPDTDTFSSALFTATLDATVLALDPSVGGGTFTAISDQISVLLRPSSGNSLVAGVDFALISVSNQPAAVPEPGGVFLLAAVVLVLGLMCRRRLSPLKPNQQL